MNFKIKINRTFKRGNLKAFATLIIEDKIYITGFKVIEKDGKLYAFNGIRKDKQGKNKDICFITNKDLRAKIYRAILVEYQIYKNFYEVSRY